LYNKFKRLCTLINPIPDVLFFSVRNKYNDIEEEKDKTSGIGLINVQRRLNLLYNQSHTLQIDKKEGWFTVLLTLNLH
jgi:LytS/YehU family sensor histidine kinase